MTVMTDLVKGKATIVAKINGMIEGTVEFDPSYVYSAIDGDVRVRDGLLRQTRSEAVINVDGGVEFKFAKIGLDELRGFLLNVGDKVGYNGHMNAIIAGAFWLEGNEHSAREYMTDITGNSLQGLLDLAMRHNVPPSVWTASLDAVSMEMCLVGSA
jgi:hypothetical protein